MILLLTPVDFDRFDRFAIDGQRLIVKSGTIGIYGANGTVYETENYSNIKVTSIGSVSQPAAGPEYFIVEYPDGSIAHYGDNAGNNSNSRSITDYSITYWENPQGARINYNYTTIGNIISISSITYGTIRALPPINTISFVYDIRNMPTESYVAGLKVLNNKILRKINIIGNGIAFKNYSLQYEVFNNSYQRLISITESCGDNSESYNPTVFKYSENIFAQGIVYAANTNVNIFGDDGNRKTAVTGDFDGDGYQDFIYLKPNSFADYYLTTGASQGVTGTTIKIIKRGQRLFPMNWVKGNQTTGFKYMDRQGWCTVNEQGPYTQTSTATFSVYSRESDTNPANLEYERTYDFPAVTRVIPGLTFQDDKLKNFFSGDFNGDGLTDVLVIEREGSTKKAYFINLDSRIITNYANDAGIIDICDRNYDNSEMETGCTLRTGDVDGDGKTDLVVFRGAPLNKIDVYSIDINNQIVLVHSQNFVLASDIGQQSQNYPVHNPILNGDFNGDGKTDFLLPGEQRCILFSKANNHFQSESLLSDFPAYPNFGNLMPGDFDNDSKTDILCYTQTTTSPITFTLRYFYNRKPISNGSEWSYMGPATINNPFEWTTPCIQTLPIFIQQSKLHPGINSIAILGTRPTTEGYVSKLAYFSCVNSIDNQKLLSEIILGNGVKDKITYKPLIPKCAGSCNSIYNPSIQKLNYPYIDIAAVPGFKVVSKIEKYSTSVYKKQLFSYYGGVSNNDGQGFLGFQVNLKTNWHGGSSSIISNISKRDMLLRGAEIENYSILDLQDLSGNPNFTTFISKSIKAYNTYDGVEYESPILTNKVFKIKNTVTLNINQLDGTSSFTTNYYDAYNNLTYCSQNIKSGTTTQKVTKTEMTYDNSPQSLEDYHIGRILDKKITTYVDTGIMKSEQLFTYFSGLRRGLPKQIKKFVNDDNTQMLTEDNVYDDYGNLTQKTLTATGVTTPRVTNLEYDTTHRFLTKKTDIENLATEFTYDLSTGNMLTEKNPFSLTTTYEYDKWNKRIKAIDYLGKSTFYNYNLSNGNITLHIYGTDPSLGASFQTFDDLGRKVQTGILNINNVWSVTSNYYDIYDRIIKVTKPYFGTNVTPDGDVITYDEYGRIRAASSYTGKVVTTEYSGLTTVVTEGLKTKTIVKNSLGQIISVSDNPGGKINYTYYADGNLKTSNYDGIITTIEQNGWGKKKNLLILLRERLYTNIIFLEKSLKKLLLWALQLIFLTISAKYLRKRLLEILPIQKILTHIIAPRSY